MKAKDVEASHGTALGASTQATVPVLNATTNLSAPAFENEHVHDVYEEIASHFSSTRYKPWPAVSRFLSAQAAGRVGLDIGCGNGKYFGVNPNVFIIGSDRSFELSAIACRRASPHSIGQGDANQITADGDAGTLLADACVADNIALPHAKDRFDFAISVAVIHHFATRNRRIAAIRAILDTVKPNPKATLSDTSLLQTAGTSADDDCGGSVFLCVWALEQRGSRRGWDRGMRQDVLVPWVKKEKKSEHTPNDRVFQRYYHLYAEGELEEDIKAAGGRVLNCGYEADNWWAIATRFLPSLT